MPVHFRWRAHVAVCFASRNTTGWWFHLFFRRNHDGSSRGFPQPGSRTAREPVTMPVAAPGRWVKGEAKSLLGGTRPRTPAPGESPRVAENAGTKVAEYRSTPPVARHDGDRRGSPWFSWRAIAVGCVLGALAVLAVLRAFPSVAAAVVPTPGPAVAVSHQVPRPACAVVSRILVALGLSRLEVRSLECTEWTLLTGGIP